MTCPDERKLYELLISDEADQEVLKHVQSCEGCKEKLKSISMLEDTLESFWKQFGTTECPAPLILVRYKEGSLTPQENESLKKHLSVCKSCSLFLQEVGDTEKDLADIENELQIKEKVNEVLSGFVHDRHPELNGDYQSAWNAAKCKTMTEIVRPHSRSQLEAGSLGGLDITPAFVTKFYPLIQVIVSTLLSLGVNACSGDAKTIAKLKADGEKYAASSNLLEELIKHIASNNS